MELFYSDNIAAGRLILSGEDSLHCVKVLRHRAGDTINVMDGKGTMYVCRLDDACANAAAAQILESFPRWGAHPYNLTMAVCPTKNNDRYEWFVEKATEMGVDRIVPVIGERSERKVFKTERAGKIALSASKQSLKAAVPGIAQPVSVRDFILSGCESSVQGGLKLIAYCFEDPALLRRSISEALEEYYGSLPSGTIPQITVLIGPEGDFSPAEASLALESGFVPVHLGASRLRTETAAVGAVAAVYFSKI